MAQGPINEAPYRLLEDVTSRTTQSFYCSRTSTAVRSAPTPASARWSRSRSACASAPTARSKATPSSAPASRSRMRFSSGVSSSTTSSRARPPRAGCRTRATGSSCRPRWSVERGSARGQWSRVESAKANGATQTRGWLRRGQRFGSRVGEYGDELSSIRAGASEREHLNDALGKEPQPANDR
jgi:hypothetical protein